MAGAGDHGVRDGGEDTSSRAVVESGDACGDEGAELPELRHFSAIGIQGGDLGKVHFSSVENAGIEGGDRVVNLKVRDSLAEKSG
jgi:hypothetical protein